MEETWDELCKWWWVQHNLWNRMDRKTWNDFLVYVIVFLQSVIHKLINEKKKMMILLNEYECQFHINMSFNWFDMMQHASSECLEFEYYSNWFIFNGDFIIVIISNVLMCFQMIQMVKIHSMTSSCLSVFELIEIFRKKDSIQLNVKITIQSNELVILDDFFFLFLICRNNFFQTLCMLLELWLMLMIYIHWKLHYQLM